LLDIRGTRFDAPIGIAKIIVGPLVHFEGAVIVALQIVRPGTPAHLIACDVRGTGLIGIRIPVLVPVLVVVRS
jgi:hypothetical protein